MQNPHTRELTGAQNIVEVRVNVGDSGLLLSLVVGRKETKKKKRRKIKRKSEKG